MRHVDQYLFLKTPVQINWNLFFKINTSRPCCILKEINFYIANIFFLEFSLIEILYLFIKTPVQIKRYFIRIIWLQYDLIYVKQINIHELSLDLLSWLLLFEKYSSFFLSLIIFCKNVLFIENGNIEINFSLLVNTTAVDL